MNERRQLLKSTWVAGATGLLPAIGVQAQGEMPAQTSVKAVPTVRWENWSGIQSCQPAQRLVPPHPADLAKWLKQSSEKFRCVGAGHSFTPLVPTPGVLLSLDRWSGVVRHDAQRSEVTVQAGTRLSVLNRELAARGLALHNLPDINVQTLGGAFATGTHGTGVQFPALHAHIKGLRMLTPQGDLLHCSRQQNADLFAAAKVSLGALGVLTEVDVAVRPLYHLRKRLWIQSTDSLLEAAATLAQQHRNFEFYVLPHTGMSAGITHDEVPPTAPTHRSDADEEALHDLKQLRDFLSGWPRARRWLAQQFIGEGEQEVVVDVGWKLLSSVRRTRFNETEFHVSREKGIACLRDVLRVLERRPDVFFPLEFRYVTQDDAWLSPFFGRDSCSIAVHALAGEDYSYLLSELGPVFRHHGGRPHWGKLHDLTAAEFGRMYPKWSAFKAIRAELDPKKRLLNGHLNALMGT